MAASIEEIFAQNAVQKYRPVRVTYLASHKSTSEGLDQ